MFSRFFAHLFVVGADLLCDTVPMGTCDTFTFLAYKIQLNTLDLLRETIRELTDFHHIVNNRRI